MPQLITLFSAGVRAASLPKLGTTRIPAALHPLSWCLAQTEIGKTGGLLACAERRGLAGEPGGVVALSCSDIQWLLPMGLCRLSSQLCTSGAERQVFLVQTRQRVSRSDLLGAWCWSHKASAGP